MKRIVDSMTSKHPAKVVGVSLKMYMDRAATVAWAREVKSLLASHPAVTSGVISVFSLPSFPLIADVAEIFEGTKLVVGSQNLSHQDAGALTGEVSPVVLKQLGCQYAAIGHFERRTHFKENESEIAEKVSAAFRNQIAPIICVGETDFVDEESSELETISQIQSALLLSTEYKNLPTVIAYEPSWAIGAEKPASPAHINQLCAAIHNELKALGLTNYWVMYGGSAGPGLFSEVSQNIDGLFLGRMAHEPQALAVVVDEFWSAQRISAVS